MDGADEDSAVTSFEVTATGDASSSTVVQLAHSQDQDCGGHILQVGIGLPCTHQLLVAAA